MQQMGAALKYIDNEVFYGVSADEYDQMMMCFKPIIKRYKSGELINNYQNKINNIGIVEYGQVSIIRIDKNGNRSILESVEKNDVFGQVLSFYGTDGDGVYAICSENCQVMFIDFCHITKRCEKACRHHSVVVENVFKLIANRAMSLSERVEVLSQRSTRGKLLCYFSITSDGRKSFMLPFSLSDLADYLSVDRSAMMREIKKLRDDNIIEQKGRQITLI